MKKGLKFATAALLSISFCSSFAMPGFAVSKTPYTTTKKPATTQTYKPAATTTPAATQNYGQYSSYSQNNYPAQNYNSDYNQNYGYSQGYNQGYSQNYNQGYNANYLPPLQGRVVTVPQGTVITTASTTDISSEYLTVGDTVSVMLGSDFSYNGNTVLPAGSSIEGNIVLAEKAGLAGKNGRIKIKFTNAVTPNGQRIPVSGKIATDDNSGILAGGTTTDRMMGVAKNVAIGSATGAVLGTIMGPLSGGKVGKGAVYGTAVLGGLGLAKSVVDRGVDAIIPANSRIDIQLEQPMTINPSVQGNY